MTVKKPTMTCAYCNKTYSDSHADKCPHCKTVFTGPRCPTCGSRAVAKIPFGVKAGAVGLFGIFALGSLGKTFKCFECGYKW